MYMFLFLKEMKLEREDTVYEKGDIGPEQYFYDLEIWKRDCARLVFWSGLWHLMRKREEFFPQLAKYRKNYSNILKHMVKPHDLLPRRWQSAKNLI